MSQTGKRARRSSQGTSNSGSVKRQKTSEAPAAMSVANHANGTTQYQHKKGSIVRVAMHNFVTYDDCEFFPGPLLNVVIGPNGSGKSSIVCGLVLGLGGAPKLLGRAKQLKEFIRHGHHEAWVELELSRARNNKNVIIRRTLHENNTSEWHLNNVMATKVEVKNLIESLNIQIDNVCQFLPQDKVVEFAKLDQYALLKETEKAVGPRGMIQQHEELMTKYSNKCDYQLQMTTKSKHLADLQAKNQVLERDVIRFRERERLLKKANDMKLKRPWIEFRARDESAEQARQRYTTAQDRFLKAQKSCIPLEREVTELEREVNKVEASRKQRQDDLQKMDQMRKKVPYQLNEYEERMRGEHRKLKMLRESQQDRQKQVQQINISIKNMEDQLARLRQIDMQAELAKLKAQEDQLTDEDNVLRERETMLNSTRNGHEHQLSAINRELKDLKNIQHQRLVNLQNDNRSAYNAHQWIAAQTEKGTFKQKVYGPVMMEVNIKDPYHIRCFETQVSQAVLYTFLTQDEDDYNLIMRELYEKQKLKINLARAYQIRGEFPPPTDINQVRRYGVDGWLLDYVEAPDIVLRFLCANANVQAAAVGNAQASHQQIFDNTPITRLFTPDSVYSASRSRYGNRNQSIRAEALRTRVRAIRGVDNVRLKALEADRERIRHQLDQQQEETRQLSASVQKNEVELRQVRKNAQDMRKSERDMDHLEGRIRSQKKRRDELSVEEDTTDKEAAIKSSINKILDKQVELTRQMTKFMTKFTALALKIDNHFILRAEKAQKLAVKKAELDRKQNEFKDLEHQAQLAKAEAKERTDEARSAKRRAEREAPMTDALSELFATFPDDLDKLNEDIARAEAQANINYRANPHLIEEFERRSEEIEKIEKELANMKDQNDTIESDIANLKNKWLTDLKGLVKRINVSFKSYFRNIGCHGRVSLAEDDDFAKYGLVIHVSFRAGQKPQILDACTQSGGERSVTTMLFLVSLQDLTECPFRLVDEINQGMDPTNERMIFEEVSKSACKADQPQFFLITPKLLPGLVFTPEMTVLCVMNGPWMLKQDEWETIELHK